MPGHSRSQSISSNDGGEAITGNEPSPATTNHPPDCYQYWDVPILSPQQDRLRLGLRGEPEAINAAFKILEQKIRGEALTFSRCLDPMNFFDWLTCGCLNKVLEALQAGGTSPFVWKFSIDPPRSSTGQLLHGYTLIGKIRRDTRLSVPSTTGLSDPASTSTTGGPTPIPSQRESRDMQGETIEIYGTQESRYEIVQSDEKAVETHKMSTQRGKTGMYCPLFQDHVHAVDELSYYGGRMQFCKGEGKCRRLPRQDLFKLPHHGDEEVPQLRPVRDRLQEYLDAGKTWAITDVVFRDRFSERSDKRNLMHVAALVFKLDKDFSKTRVFLYDPTQCPEFFKWLSHCFEVSEMPCRLESLFQAYPDMEFLGLRSHLRDELGCQRQIVDENQNRYVDQCTLLFLSLFASLSLFDKPLVLSPNLNRRGRYEIQLFYPKRLVNGCSDSSQQCRTIEFVDRLFTRKEDLRPRPIDNPVPRQFSYQDQRKLDALNGILKELGVDSTCTDDEIGCSRFNPENCVAVGSERRNGSSANGSESSELTSQVSSEEFMKTCYYCSGLIPDYAEEIHVYSNHEEEVKQLLKRLKEGPRKGEKQCRYCCKPFSLEDQPLHERFCYPDNLFYGSEVNSFLNKLRRQGPLDTPQSADGSPPGLTPASDDGRAIDGSTQGLSNPSSPTGTSKRSTPPAASDLGDDSMREPIRSRAAPPEIDFPSEVEEGVSTQLRRDCCHVGTPLPRFVVSAVLLVLAAGLFASAGFQVFSEISPNSCSKRTSCWNCAWTDGCAWSSESNTCEVNPSLIPSPVSASVHPSPMHVGSGSGSSSTEVISDASSSSGGAGSEWIVDPSKCYVCTDFSTCEECSAHRPVCTFCDGKCIETKEQSIDRSGGDICPVRNALDSCILGDKLGSKFDFDAMLSVIVIVLCVICILMSLCNCCLRGPTEEELRQTSCIRGLLVISSLFCLGQFLVYGASLSRWVYLQSHSPSPYSWWFFHYDSALLLASTGSFVSLSSAVWLHRTWAKRCSAKFFFCMIVLTPIVCDVIATALCVAIFHFTKPVATSRSEAIVDVSALLFFSFILVISALMLLCQGPQLASGQGDLPTSFWVPIFPFSFGAIGLLVLQFTDRGVVWTATSVLSVLTLSWFLIWNIGIRCQQSAEERNSDEQQSRLLSREDHVDSEPQSAISHSNGARRSLAGERDSKEHEVLRTFDNSRSYGTAGAA